MTEISYMHKVLREPAATGYGLAEVPDSAEAPVPMRDDITTSALQVEFDPRANDVAPTGALTVTGVTQPTVGTAAVVTGGASVQWSRTSSTATQTEFDYTVQNAAGRTGTGRIRIFANQYTAPPPAAGVEYPSTPTRIVNVEAGSYASLKAALDAALPGDEIRVPAGTYRGADYQIKRAGTLSKPIVVRATTPVKANLDTVTTTGAWLQFNLSLHVGHYIFHGLNFDARTWSSLGNTLITVNRTESTTPLEHIKFRRCFFHGHRGSCIYLKSTNSTRIKYFEISNCAFAVDDWSDWTGTQAEFLAQGEPEKSRRMIFTAWSSYTLISRCLLYRAPAGLYGYSISNQTPIMVGEGSVGDKPSLYVRVVENLFYECYSGKYGGPVSELKASDCTYVGNTLYKCAGHFSTRQGYRNKFLSNYLYKHQTVPGTGSWAGGMYIFSRDHLCAGNIFDDCVDAMSLRAIEGTVSGDASGAAQNDLYPSTVRAIFRGNKVVNSNPATKTLIMLNDTWGSGGFPPVNCRVEAYTTNKGKLAGAVGTFTITADTTGDYTEATQLGTSDVGLNAPYGGE